MKDPIKFMVATFIDSESKIRELCSTLKINHINNRYNNSDTYKPSVTHISSIIARLNSAIRSEIDFTDDNIIIKLVNVMSHFIGDNYSNSDPNEIIVFCTQQPYDKFKHLGFKKFVYSFNDKNRCFQNITVLIKERKVILIYNYRDEASQNSNSASTDNCRYNPIIKKSLDINYTESSPINLPKRIRCLTLYNINICYLTSYNSDAPVQNKTSLISIKDEFYVGIVKTNELPIYFKFCEMDTREPSSISHIFPNYSWELILDIKLFFGIHHTEFKSFKVDRIWLTHFDIGRVFVPGLWLGDNSINMYFQLIKLRSLKTVRVYDTFFSKIPLKELEMLFKNNVRIENVFKYKILLFPTHVKEANHWILYCVNIPTRTVLLYDSFNLHVHNKHTLTLIFLYLSMESVLWAGRPLNLREWSIEFGKSPNQSNYIDCGIYVCATAEILSRNQSINYNSNDIHLLRQRITYELMMGKLLF